MPPLALLRRSLLKGQGCETQSKFRSQAKTCPAFRVSGRWDLPWLVAAAERAGADRIINGDGIVRIVIAIDHKLAGTFQELVAVA